MTPEEARTQLVALLAPINTQLDQLDALAPDVRADNETAKEQYLTLIAQTWPAGIGQEDAITQLQEQQLEAAEPVDVDAFWRRLHQAKQLGVTIGY